MDSFFKTGICKQTSKFPLERFATREKIFELESPCKVTVFRSKKRLEQYLSTIRACRRAEEQFLQNNSKHVNSGWWGQDRLIFVDPTVIGFYPAPYAQLYFAKFVLSDTDLPFEQAYSDCGLDIFFDTLYPFLQNRYPNVLPSNPRQYLFFCFNLQRLVFCPGNARHAYKPRHVFNKELYCFDNV